MGQGLYRNEKESKKTVYYSGTDTLKRGYALCYDRDNITAKDGSGSAIAATASSWGRHGWVEKPASGNLHNFAGIVADAPDKTGPFWVSIIEPDSIARSMDVYTEENCTADVTMLTIKPGSYILGGAGEGLIIGRALQTVNRSSSNGLVQALIGALDILQLPYGLLTPSGTVNSFSSKIWETCPWNTDLVHKYFEDFVNIRPGNVADGTALLTATSTTETNDWIQTENTSGLTAFTEDVGGVLRVSSEANVAAEDGLTVMWRQTPWVPTSGKRIWFEARVKMNNVVTPDEYTIGLADTLTEACAGGTIDDVVDKILFYTESGTTTLTMEFITAKTTVQEQTTGAATVANATWIQLGFIADLASVVPYVNNVAGTAHTTASKLPTSGTGLGIVLSSAVDQTGAIATLDVDWVRIAQLK